MSRNSSTLMRRGSSRARPGGSGGTGTVLVFFIAIAVLTGAAVWYFYLGGPAGKKGGIGADYAPVQGPTPQVTIKNPL